MISARESGIPNTEANKIIVAPITSTETARYLLDLAPAPWAVAIDASESFAPMLRARKVDKTIAIGRAISTSKPA